MRREMKMEGAHLSMTDPLPLHCRSREGKETEWNGGKEKNVKFLKVAA